MLKFIFLIIFFVFSLSQAMPSYHINSTSNGYELRLTVPEPSLQQIPVKKTLRNGTTINETFVYIDIPGFNTGGDNIGHPQAVMSGFQLAMVDKDISIEVSEVVEETYHIDHRVFPVQEPDCYCGEHSSRFLSLDADAYKRNPERSSPVTVRDIYAFRGMYGADIVVNPMYYNPIENSITIIKSMKIEFIMRKPTVIRAWGSRLWADAMQSIFKNLQGDFLRDIAYEKSVKEQYLIITNASYKDNADIARFADYRQKLGYSVEIVEASSVGTSKEDYTSFIRGKKPTYCILVGSSSDFPHYTTTFYNTRAKTYIPYVSSTTQNPKPDIGLGLWFPLSEKGIANIVNKTIATEKDVEQAPKRVHAAGGHSGNSMKDGESGKVLPPQHCDVIAEEMYTDYFEKEGYDAVFGFCTKTPKINASNSVKAINEGVKFVWYNGHGGKTGWTPPGGGGMSVSHLSQMSNTIYPFLFTAACLTGTFDHSSGCMHQQFSTHEKASVANIGAYQVSYMGQHALTRALHRELMEVKKVTKYGLAYFAGLCGYAYDTAKASPKQMNFAANQYHYFGDPGVECFTKVSPTPINSQSTPALQGTFNLSIKSHHDCIVFYSNSSFKDHGALSIYNLQGQLIHSVVIKPQQGFLYQWDGNKAAHKPVSTGQYIAVLSYDDISATKLFHILE